jgi:hypothetical protein
MKTTCSWCHELYDLSAVRFCTHCGHRADLPRMDCDCQRCRRQTAKGTAGKDATAAGASTQEEQCRQFHVSEARPRRLCDLLNLAVAAKKLRAKVDSLAAPVC